MQPYFILGFFLIGCGNSGDISFTIQHNFCCRQVLYTAANFFRILPKRLAAVRHILARHHILCGKYLYDDALKNMAQSFVTKTDWLYAIYKSNIVCFGFLVHFLYNSLAESLMANLVSDTIYHCVSFIKHS